MSEFPAHEKLKEHGAPAIHIATINKTGNYTLPTLDDIECIYLESKDLIDEFNQLKAERDSLRDGLKAVTVCEGLQLKDDIIIGMMLGIAKAALNTKE